MNPGVVGARSIALSTFPPPLSSAISTIHLFVPVVTFPAKKCHPSASCSSILIHFFCYDLCQLCQPHSFPLHVPPISEAKSEANVCFEYSPSIFLHSTCKGNTLGVSKMFSVSLACSIKLITLNYPFQCTRRRSWEVVTPTRRTRKVALGSTRARK